MIRGDYMTMENIGIIFGTCIILLIIGYVNYKSIITRSERILRKISKLEKK